MKTQEDNKYDKLYDWSLLHREAKHILADLLSRWTQLLDDTTKSENAYQEFVDEHAGLFWRQDQLVMSKIRLGSDYVTDFVCATDEASYGAQYDFIELESPHTPAFTQSGKASARLSSAIQQVMNWKDWIDANRNQAKRLFPSKLFNVYDDPNFTFSIYIGRSEIQDEFLALRNKYAKRLQINIHGFDNFTLRLKEKHNWVSPMIYSTEFKELDRLTINTLANPFYRSYSWNDWTNIVADPDFNIQHIFAKNCQLLLKYRTYNAELQKFMSFWNSIPQSQRYWLFHVLEQNRSFLWTR